eukprot:TRINITY_DN1958_c0_g1_i4.p1 TRINITY_DN1958_c0_g1~~TRINITY_DN1958_c0_g1_i4.p1  ORF type:complete len:303 (-),score=68.41 TRINITY_DN1958_c0_g1_i4:161-1069(-)
MTACRYFDAGWCKYGHMCRNSHKKSDTSLEIKEENSARSRSPVWLEARKWRVLSELDNLSSKFRFKVPSPTTKDWDVWESSDSEDDFETLSSSFAWSGGGGRKLNRLESATLALQECTACNNQYLAGDSLESTICESCIKTESFTRHQPNENSNALTTQNTYEENLNENNPDQNVEDDIFGTELQQENNKKRRKRKKKKSKKTKTETVEMNPVEDNEESTKSEQQMSNNNEPDQMITKKSKRRWKRKGQKRSDHEKENSKIEENIELSKNNVDFIPNYFLSHFVFWALTIFLTINYLFNQSD